MPDASIDDLKQLLVENCMLRVPAAEISEEASLFGPGGLGLDSIDALQLTVAIERLYGIAIQDPGTARQVLHSLASLREWLGRQPSPATPS